MSAVTLVSNLYLIILISYTIDTVNQGLTSLTVRHVSDSWMVMRLMSRLKAPLLKVGGGYWQQINKPSKCNLLAMEYLPPIFPSSPLQVSTRSLLSLIWRAALGLYSWCKNGEREIEFRNQELQLARTVQYGRYIQRGSCQEQGQYFHFYRAPLTAAFPDNLCVRRVNNAPLVTPAEQKRINIWTVGGRVQSLGAITCVLYLFVALPYGLSRRTVNGVLFTDLSSDNLRGYNVWMGGYNAWMGGLISSNGHGSKFDKVCPPPPLFAPPTPPTHTDK